MKKINILGIRTKILSKKTMMSYTPTLDVINNQRKKDWFVSLWHSFSYLDYQLRELVLWKITNYSKTANVTIVNRIKNKRKLWWIIKKARELKIISEIDKKMLTYIKDVRNDMAHSWYLVYNENISEKEANRIIKHSLRIISKLHKKAMRDQKKIGKNPV